MVAKQKNLVGGLLISFIIIGMVVTSLVLVQQSVFFDDFLTEDDFSIPSPALLQEKSVCSTIFPNGGGIETTCNDGKWKSFTERKSINSNIYESTITESDGKLEILATGGNRAYATYLIDVKNKDLKIQLTRATGGRTKGEGGFTISLNDKTLYRDIFSWGDFGGEDSSSFLIEAFMDIQDRNTYHVQVNGNVVGTVTITQPTAYLTIQPFGSSSGSLEMSSRVNVDIIKSRPYFNCEVEDDEVVVKDSFSAGSTFDYRDLTFRPVKLCPDSYPAVVRSFTEEGVRADVQGQLLQTLIGGCEESKKNKDGYCPLTVPEGQMYEIRYIADYKESMGERCGIDSAYDTSTNQCTKVIEEKEDIIVVQNVQETIIVGKNDHYFEGSATIDGKTISSTTLNYLCAGEDSSANVPKPRADCWQTTVSYGSESFTMTHNQEKVLDDYFKIKYLASGRYDEEDGIIGKNTFILTLLNRNLLTTKSTGRPTSDYYALYGKTKEAKLTIVNNYGTFSSQQSGFQIREVKDLLTQEKSYQIPTSFIKGEKEYSISVDTSTFGQVKYILTPYFKIGDEIFYDDEQTTLNFEVVDKIPADITLVTSAASTTVKSPNKQLDGKTLSTGDVVAILLILSVVGIFVYFASRTTKKSKKRRK